MSGRGAQFALAGLVVGLAIGGILVVAGDGAEPQGVILATGLLGLAMGLLEAVGSAREAVPAGGREGAQHDAHD